MGRIIAQTRVTNLFDETKFVQCGMLVDTGAAALILPAAWKRRLGEFPRSETVELLLANGEAVRGEACAPVEIAIEGFRPVVNEVLFVGSEASAKANAAGGNAGRPRGGSAQRGRAVARLRHFGTSPSGGDMLGHRLVPVRYIDMK